MSFDYTTNRPIGNQTPADQREALEQNTNTISNWVDIDHIGFNNADGGKHAKITLNGFESPAQPTDPSESMILYGAAGTGDSSSPQLFAVNDNDTFHLSPIRAYAQVSWNGSARTIELSYNITNIVRDPGGGRYTVTWDSSAVDSINYMVFCTPGIILNSTTPALVNVDKRNAGNIILVFTDPTQNKVAEPSSFSVMILDL